MHVPIHMLSCNQSVGRLCLLLENDRDFLQYLPLLLQILHTPDGEKHRFEDCSLHFAITWSNQIIPHNYYAICIEQTLD